MALWLQIILAIVLLALGVCLVPLLLQLRRTAASVQLLADSARVDIRQIADDVHHLRSRADELADLAAVSLALPLGLGRILASIAHGLESFLGNVGLPWMGALLTVVKFFLNLVRRPKHEKEAEAKEEANE
jgi:hypothetical protein